MQEQNLFFNILTFDWPKQPVTFYLHEEEQDKFPRIHRSLFPKQVANIFPQVATNPTKEFISCAFTGEAEGFTPLDIDFKTDNQGYYIRFRQKKTKGAETLPISEQAFQLLGEKKKARG
ncbi:MAG: hypothetical protein ACOYXA_02535 [Bacteroidota bacterium]